MWERKKKIGSTLKITEEEGEWGWGGRGGERKEGKEGIKKQKSVSYLIPHRRTVIILK